VGDMSPLLIRSVILGVLFNFICKLS
jgi:hypothetical protein